MGGCRLDDQWRKVLAVHLLAFILAVIIGKEAMVDVARLHQRLTSIIRSAQISWYIAEVS